MGLSALVKVCVMDGLVGDGLLADKHTHFFMVTGHVTSGQECTTRPFKYCLIDPNQQTSVIVLQ